MADLVFDASELKPVEFDAAQLQQPVPGTEKIGLPGYPTPAKPAALQGAAVFDASQLTSLKPENLKSHERMDAEHRQFVADSMKQLGTPAYPKPPQPAIPEEMAPQYDPTFKQDFGIMSTPMAGVYGMVRGVERAAGPAQTALGDIGQAQLAALGKKPVPPQSTEATAREGAGAVHDITSGAMQAATPFIAGHLATAPIGTALSLWTAAAADLGTRGILKAVGLPEEYVNAAGDLAAVFGGAAIMKGLGTAAGRVYWRSRIKSYLQDKVNREYAARATEEKAAAQPKQIEAPEEPAAKPAGNVQDAEFWDQQPVELREEIPTPGKAREFDASELKPAPLMEFNASELRPVDTPKRIAGTEPEPISPEVPSEQLPEAFFEHGKPVEEANAQPARVAEQSESSAPVGGSGADAGAAQAEPAAPVEAQGEEPAAVPVEPESQALTPDSFMQSMGVFDIPTNQIHADPVRFQFKRDVGQAGAGEELKAVRKWDTELAGITSVWKDPVDGKTYVINGHHRLDLANRLEVPSLTSRYIDAPDAQTARAKGALINIAEGRGTSIDAAKFFRDTGLTPDDLDNRGISLRGPVARDGLAMSRLDPRIFDMVLAGELPVKRASMIGEALPKHEDQTAVIDMLDRSKQRLTDEEVGELIRRTGSAERRTEVVQTLFGQEEHTENLALKEAQVSSYVRKRLGQERRLFEIVGKDRAAKQLGDAGNVINANRNHQIAEQAAQAQAVYDKLSLRRGAVDDIIRETARAIAGGESESAAKERAYGEIRAAVSAILGGGKERVSGGLPEGNSGGGGEDPAVEQGGLFGSERGGVDPNLLSLGALKFAQEDVIPAARKAAAYTRETFDDITKLVAPTIRTESAALTGLSLRHRMAQFARRFEIARERLKESSDFFDKRTPEQNYDFIDKVENGLGREWSGDTPEDRELLPIAKLLNKMMDERRKAVQDLGEGDLSLFYRSYFPHIFEREAAASNWVTSWFGNKRSLEGPKSFLKHREFPTFKEALDAGLTPVSDNPVRLILLKAREMDRFLMAHHVLRDLEAQGIASKIEDKAEQRQAVETGYTRIVDPVGGGKWYAEDGAAQVFNNYLSPGLRGKPWYNAASLTNNVMNQSNLGLSAFHLTGEVIRSAVSRAALGMEDVLNGKPVRGSVRIATNAAGPFLDFFHGSKALREYFKPGSQGAPYAAIVDGLMKGGGRAKLDDFYVTNMVDKMKLAFRRGNVVGGLVRSPFAALEYLAKPIMEWSVPRLKMGVFLGMATDALGRLGPDATLDAQRAEMASIWDSVDNRMGQLVYDNLFWNKTFKDLMMLTQRAVGWNLGTIREHMVRAPYEGPHGKTWRRYNGEQHASHKFAWCVALPLVAGMVGALYQYLHTGKGPAELKDYFFPQDGSTNRNGTPERVAMPMDIKDIRGYAVHPVQTVEGKASPLLNTLTSMLHNKDFFDRPIRNEDDPFMQQLKQEAHFVALQTSPFTLRDMLGQPGKKPGIPPTLERQAETFLGIMKAPADIQGGPRRKNYRRSPY